MYGNSSLGTSNTPTPTPTPYTQTIINTFGSDIVAFWPLTETTGVVANDIVNSRNGSYSGTYTLADTVGPDGTYPSFAGTGGIDVYSASLSSAFPSDEGSIILWGKVTDNSVWSDGSANPLAFFRVDASNFVRIQRYTTNNTLQWQYMAGGVNKTVILNANTTEWFQAAITWSKSQDLVKTYFKGQQNYYNFTGLGTWTGSLSSTFTKLFMSTAGSWWDGSGANVVLLNRPATATEINDLSYAPDVRIYRLSIIGDSISSSVTSWNQWPYPLSRSWNNGSVGIINHADPGDSITSDLDNQVAAAANDDADVIIIAMGRNDDNSGDMAALQSKIEGAITTLQTTNPDATIYYLNVLPTWTDSGGGTVIDKSNIRAAISAACLAINNLLGSVYYPMDNSL